MLQEVFMKSYDAIIIGFEKGGKTLAGYMAKQGKRVAMIEKSNQMYGGTCINEGCIPSKSLIIQAAGRQMVFSDKTPYLIFRPVDDRIQYPLSL